MKKIIVYFFVSIISIVGFGQQQDIVLPIKTLFDGMRAGDEALISSAFADGAILETLIEEKSETRRQATMAVDFIRAAGQPHEQVWDEVIWSYDVKQDGPLATVWTEYTFYIGDQFSHCGVNAFQLIRMGHDWKITHITDTRRQQDCRKRQNSDNSELGWQVEINHAIWRPFKEAYENLDAIAMNDLHSPDVIRGNKWNILIGDEYMQQNAKRFQEARNRGDKRTIDFYFDLRKTTETHEISTGFYKVTSIRDEIKNQFYGYFHVVIKKIEGKWQIIYDWDHDEFNGVRINETTLAGKTKFQ